MKKSFKFFGLILAGVILFPTVLSAQVITKDDKELLNLGKQVYNEGESLIQSVQSLQQSVTRAIDLGAYMDTIFDVSFLIPKPELSSDVVDSVPKTEGDSASGAGDVASSATSAVGGGDGASQQFESSSKVKASVSNNMQVRDTSQESSTGNADVDNVVSAMTGGEVSSGSRSDEISRKKAQLAKSKQAFARYALATALVHRTLAHRTFEDNKEIAQEQAAKTTTIRETHTGKSVGNMALADTFNRLLMSQAAANGLSAFSAMEDMEGKIDFNLRGITDKATGGVLGNVGGILGQ